MGFTDTLGMTEKMILEGNNKETVTVATAKWPFDARDASEISFGVGDVINVIQPHESGWWTGEVNGKTGLFPVNRTDPQVMDIAGFKTLRKRGLTSPMFQEAPPLPSADDRPGVPKTKAAKLLGVSDKEAEALSPRATSNNNGNVHTSPGRSGGSAKALAVLGFDDDQQQQQQQQQGGKRGSKLTQLGRKLSSGVRKLSVSSNDRGSPRRHRGNSRVDYHTTRSPSIKSPRDRAGSSPRRGATISSNRNQRPPKPEVRFAAQLAEEASGSRRGSAPPKHNSNSGSYKHEMPRREVRSAEVERESLIHVQQAESTDEEEESWGDVNEDNLIY